MAETDTRTNETRELPPGAGAGPPLPPGPGPDVATPETLAAATTPAPGSTAEVAPASRPPAPRPYTNGRPESPEDMRREIEATRARLSGTLDELETRLVRRKEELNRKKEQLWDKVTLQGPRRKLAEEPFRSMAIAFVVGYVVAAIRD